MFVTSIALSVLSVLSSSSCVVAVAAVVLAVVSGYGALLVPRRITPCAVRLYVYTLPPENIHPKFAPPRLI